MPTSKATLRRFWAGIPVQSKTFKEICKVIGIDDWKRIVRPSDLARRSKSHLLAQNQRRLAFAIAGSIEEIDKRKLDAIVALLNKIGGDMSIEILDVEEGSIKLILSGSPTALARVESLFRSGGLQEVANVPVRCVVFNEQRRDYGDAQQPYPGRADSTYRTLKSRQRDGNNEPSSRASWGVGLFILVLLLAITILIASLG